MKKVFCFNLFFILSTLIFAQTVCISQIYVINEDGKEIKLFSRVNEDLKQELSKKWFDNCVDFKSVFNEQTGAVQSSFDALKVCNLLDEQFLIYGYLQKNESNFICELKLFDKSIKKVIKTFFDSDDIDNYDRLTKNMSDKIAEYFIDALKIDINGKKDKDIHPFELSIPASLYYWAPLDKEWSKVLLGVCGCEVGLDLFPEYPVLIRDGKTIDFNYRFNLGYKYGLGNPEYYRLNYNTISVSAPIICNIHFNSLNTLSLGIGPVYEFNILNFEKKYENFSNYFQNNLGLEFIFEYKYKLRDNLLLNFELDMDIHFLEYSFLVVKPKVGLIWNFYRRNK